MHADRTILYRQLVLLFSPAAEGVASSPSARHIPGRFFPEPEVYDGHGRFGNYEVRRSLCGGLSMRFVLIFFIVALFCQAIIHLPVESRGIYGPVQWQSEQEKTEFHKLLRKHGQHRQISVIFYDGSKTYFINEKGEKCLFK
jgi:hypothetical protein